MMYDDSNIFIDLDDGETITVTDVRQETNEPRLAHWFDLVNEQYEVIRAFVESYKLAGVEDADWKRKAAGKMAYLRIGRRAIEMRMADLGYKPPYPACDPRTRQIQSLELRVRRLRGVLSDHGIAEPEAA